MSLPRAAWPVKAGLLARREVGGQQREGPCLGLGIRLLQVALHARRETLCLLWINGNSATTSTGVLQDFNGSFSLVAFRINEDELISQYLKRGCIAILVSKNQHVIDRHSKT